MPPGRGLAIPLAFTLALFALSFVPDVRQHPRLAWSFWGAAVVLLAWNGLLFAGALQSRRRLIVLVELRKQHYLQACAQSSVLIYWGWYWREVYDSAALIAAQLVFAYAFDALLTWSRRDTYTLGFGPFPIIFSTNLFLWFKPDYFHLQFLMVAVGFAGKALIQWTKDGRRTHIFNPSSFTLAVFSFGLILTGTTHLTWGLEIATTQLLPPHIYLLIFVVALPGQFLFGVAAMTLAAVATTYTINLVYFWATGVYYFVEPSVPIAVFLSMHLLFTDPSTSPRTDLGRLMFGVLYGLSVVVVYGLLVRAGVPPFYDKLLAVPVLNLMIQAIDRVARSNLLTRFDPAVWSASRSARSRHLAYIAVWAVIFTTMQLITETQVAIARADIQMSVGKTDDAIATYQELLRDTPDHVVVLNKLGSTLRQAGRPADAVPSLEHAVKLRPDDAEAHYNLSQAYVAIGRPVAAVAEFREALRVRPDWPAAMGALALTEATSGEAGAYDPDDAMRLATRAADLTGRNDAPILDALAAAQAAAGRFSEATLTAERAATLADASAPRLAADIRGRLARYRAGQPLVSVDR